MKDYVIYERNVPARQNRLFITKIQPQISGPTPRLPRFAL